MSKDNINPDHYKQSSFECIDAMAAAVIDKKGIEAVCVATAIKYLWRYEAKNGIEDVKKAEWYIKRLIKVLEEKENKKEALEVNTLTLEEQINNLETVRDIFVFKNAVTDKDKDGFYDKLSKLNNRIEELKTKKKQEENKSNLIEGQKFINREARKILENLLGKRFIKVKVLNSDIFEVKDIDSYDKLFLVPVKGNNSKKTRTTQGITVGYFDLINNELWKQEDS